MALLGIKTNDACCCCCCCCCLLAGWLTVQYWLVVAAHDDVCDFATSVCGPDVAIVRAMFFAKPKEGGKIVDWHQDREGPNNLPELRPGDDNVTVWTALDPCLPNSGPVIRGSHKVGEVPFGPTSAEAPALTPEQQLQYAPEEERVELHMQAGEVVLLHNMLLHKSDLNSSGKPRRAFSTWYTSHRPGTKHFATAFSRYSPNTKGEAQGVNGRPELEPADGGYADGTTDASRPSKL